MEDFSNFITEEIFILNEDTPTLSKVENPTIQESYKLGIVAGDIAEEEKVLLGNILDALKVEKEDILQGEEVQLEKSNRWIIFATNYVMNSVSLEYYKPTTIQTASVLLAQPLSMLRDSQEQKQKLWKALKQLFDM